jgi:hypothetical protein
MPKPKTAVITVGFVVLLAVVITLTPTGGAIAQGMRAVLVEVVNTPDVNVNGAVTIGNRPTNPIPILDIGRPAREAFGARFFCLGIDDCTETLTVPAGKLLVIETYSANCGTGPDISVAVRSSIEIPQATAFSPRQFFFPLERSVLAPVGFGGLGRHHEMTAAVRIYADPGTEVSFGFRKSPGGSGFVCEASVSGLLSHCGTGFVCAAP